MSSFLNKAKQAAETAVAKTKEGVEDVQQKRELSQAYGDLGKTTFELIEAGEISNPAFDATVAKIRDLNAKLADTPAVPSDGGDPPAMPT